MPPDGVDRFGVYDERLADTDRGDVEFYTSLAADAQGPVLELACGTGRIYLELLRAGVDADGLDRSAGALARLRERATEAGLSPSVWRADMRAFAADREYALAVCPFNAFQHLLTVEDRLSALERVHDALAPGGAFVLDLFVPSFEVICATYGAWQEEELRLRGERYTFRTRTRLVDEPRQVFEVENELRTPGGETVVSERHRLSMLPLQEVACLARLSPFEEWSVESGFDGGPVEHGDDVQVWTLRRGD